MSLWTDNAQAESQCRLTTDLDPSGGGRPCIRRRSICTLQVARVAKSEQGSVHGPESLTSLLEPLAGASVECTQLGL